ncbi:MAG: flagellar motor switch protein FliG [Bacillota bacterium]
MNAVRAGLSGRQKAAILLISLGPELSAEVVKHLRSEEMEQLTLEIASTRNVAKEAREKVVEEFCDLCAAQEYLDEGGIEYARAVLERAVGGSRAGEIIERLTANLQVRPFDFARKTEPAQLLNFIQDEHPQTVALITAHLDANQAAMVLASLPPDRQVDVARRVALMDRTSPDVVREVERVLERKLSSVLSQDYAVAGGVQAVVDVLNRVDRGTEKTIMEALEVQDPELADEIKRRMFLFEDIVRLDDRAVQRVLRDVDLNRDLPLALRVCSDDVRNKIYRNMSSRAVENLRENIEFLGPVRLREVEEAQQRIVNTVRRLEEEGEIVLSRGGGDEIVV